MWDRWRTGFRVDLREFRVESKVVRTVSGAERRGLEVYEKGRG